MDRKNVLYIAVSLDGMIAREDGSIDWLEEFEGEGDNGYSDFYQTVDTVILGWSTYEHVKVLTPVFPYQDKTCYVFTGSPYSYQDEHVTFINEGARAFTDRLKQEKGLNIWIAGGAELVNAFMKEDGIDEFIITVIPVVLGSGIPLFQELTNETKLRLKGMKQFGQAVQLQLCKIIRKRIDRCLSFLYVSQSASLSAGSMRFWNFSISCGAFVPSTTIRYSFSL